MGTTVTALLQSGDQLALAHIGDSRAYTLHKGELTQITHDHTFVQMLVDEGRITPEEADTHPQRSVVMRVLGDVGSAPELDLSFHEAVPGDRWMLCSDGLTGFASLDDIHEALATIEDPGDACERLIELALAGGGGDNVTVVVGDVLEPDADHDLDDFGEAVGSVRINPSYALLGGADQTNVSTSQMDVVFDEVDAPTVPLDDNDTQPLPDPLAPEAGVARTSDSDTSIPRPDAAARHDAASQEDTAEVPVDDEFAAPPRTARSAVREDDHWDEDADLADWGEEPRRRPWVPIIVSVIVVLALAAAGLFGWRYVQSQYYVAASQGSVAVYRGLPQSLGPISMSSLSETTDVQVTDLSTFSQQRLEATIPADSQEAALAVVDTLRVEATRNSAATAGESADQNGADPAPSPSPSEGGVSGGVTDESGQSSSPAGASLTRGEGSG
jgi:protein phosphatase